MWAGRLDRRVAIQQRSDAQSLAGDPMATWATVKTVAMGKRDLKAEERFAGSQVAASVTTLFTARAQAVRDVDPATYRLVYEGQVFNIEGRRELGRNDGVEFQCSARGEAGLRIAG